MTTVTASPSSAVAAPAHVRFRTLVRAEWIALTSLRGTYASWIIGTLLVILPAAGMAAIFGYEFLRSGSDPALAQALPSTSSLAMNGAIFAVAVATIVGAAAYAKEHSTGSLRSQLAASPRRFPLLAAKATVVAASVFVASVVAFALAVAAAAAVSSLFGIAVSVDDPILEIVVPLLGGGLFTASVAVFAIGLAAILRSETWAVTLALVFLFVVPMILVQLPWEWATQISDVLLGTTGQSLTMVRTEITGDLLVDALLTLGWAAVAFFGGAAVMSRRDA
ncbi:ABC transporter permease subunit [Microbacterium suaedae]|uniref:ABC transporter permease subunit n=1 Tax=Microbacterium suaedae TaxID=2067813 RepID=UPI000DA18D1E|nr:ABC transporter permease subunit [Microbacterium suaedae]